MHRIIEENLDYLVRFAFFRVESKPEAEDIVHEAVLRLLEKRKSEISPESIRLYLFRIVYNLCQDKSRKSKPTVSLEFINDIPDNEEDYLDCEEAERLNVLLESLPTKEREIVRMNVIDGLSFVDIAHILSIPASTAKSRFISGMTKLRKHYSTEK